MTCLNLAISEVEDTTVLVTLLTGADAAIDTAETLTMEEGVVLEDEDDDKDGIDIEGGPEPATAVGGLEVEVLQLVEAAVEVTLAVMEMLWTGAEGGSME